MLKRREIRKAGRRSILTAVAFAALVAIVGAVPAHAQKTILTPGVSGDQLFFIYDATGSRVSFIAVSNFATEDIVVETAFYGQTLTLIATEVATIPGRGSLPLIDPSDTTRFPGVLGTAGLVVITPIMGVSDTRPVVPPAPSDDLTNGPLFGTFTLVNTDLGAGFGENPFARLAVRNDTGLRAPAGEMADGNAVGFQRFAPNVLSIPFHFNPQNLSDPANDGNRIILTTFADDYGPTNYRLAESSSSFDYIMETSAGTVLVDTIDNVQVSAPIAVNGVVFTNLQALSGPLTLTGPGKVTFIATVAPPIPAPTNLFGVFAQALGTFAVGSRMVGGSSIALP